MFCHQPLKLETCSSAQWEMSMIHSIKITIKDLYSNTLDDWIVSFKSSGYHVSHNNNRNDFFPHSVVGLHSIDPPRVVSWNW